MGNEGVLVMLSKGNKKICQNNGMTASAIILSLLVIILGLSDHCWARSDRSSEQGGAELSAYSGKITRVLRHDHMPRGERPRPDQERKAIVVGTKRFYITIQTSWENSAGESIDNTKVTLKRGDEVLLKYNERTNEIVDIRLEGMIRKENRSVTATNPKSRPTPKQKIIFRNGVYKNVYVK